MRLITEWFQRNLSDPQVVILSLSLVALFGVVVFLGGMLAPVLAAIVIAYLLEGLVRVLSARGLPRLLAVLIVFIGFMCFVILVLFGLLPLVSTQATQLVQEIPAILGQGQEALLRLPELYPEILSVDQLNKIIGGVGSDLTAWGQTAVSVSLSSVIGVITILVYLILLPLLVFFFLKDKVTIIEWAKNFLPKEDELVIRVWRDVDRQIGNYVRGKFWEIIIVWGVSYLTFLVLGLQYAMVLSVCVGISVLVPFVGVAVVTIPVVLVAGFQWGWSADFAYLIIAYIVIMVLDANLLVPLLFSEVTNLHPVAIIVAVLLFGGLWGFLGLFFAIPLANLVQAVINAWPKSDHAHPVVD